MAMMISKFHRLIQNKITWWIVLVIIVFSFVIWGSQARNANSSARHQTAVATLDNKPIEQADFREAYAATHLGLVLQYGREINITPQVDEIIRRQAWQRIAALHEAEKLGIIASDDEVAAMTQQLPLFHTKEGQFDMQAYETFVQKFLPKVGFTKHGFDEFIRGEIIMQKATMLIARLLLVSPYDARRTYQALNDRFTVDYAIITPDLVEKNVKAGRDDAKALFDRDPGAYKIPEMAVVRYVAIPYSNFLAKAEAKDDDVQKYYNDNLEEYALPSTNKADKGVSTNAEFSTETTKYKPVEDVKPQIVSLLKQKIAAEMAKSNALALVEAMQGSATAKPTTFDEAAKQFGLPVSISKPFGELGDVPGISVGSDFNRAAFGLTRDEGGNISEPVAGHDACYVLAYHDRLAERIPTFDEVIEMVIPDAKKQAVEDAMTALAKKTRDAMDIAAKAGQPVADAAKKFGVSLKTTEPFTASGGEDQKVENFDVLIRSVLPHNAGEVTDLIPTRDGIFIAHVRERQSADASAFEQLRPQIANSIRRQQGRQLFEGWQEYLLKRDKFEDLLKKATGEDT